MMRPRANCELNPYLFMFMINLFDKKKNTNNKIIDREVIYFLIEVTCFFFQCKLKFLA